MIVSAAGVQRPGGYREVVVLALPLVLSMLSRTLMVSIESALLGRVSTVEQGAVGLAGALLWPLLVACNFSGMGVQIAVAQAHGAQQDLTCGALAWQGIYLSLLAWLPMLLAGLGSAWLVQLSAPSPELLGPTTSYLRIALLGGLPSLLNLSFIGFFRGLGDTRTPFLVTIGIVVLTTLLDVLLIFGVAGVPRLGIAGAAYASVSATALGTACYAWLFLRRGRRAGLLPRRRMPFEPALCWRLVRMSWPIGAQGVLELGAWTLFTVLVARLGVVEAAAHTIAIRVISLAYMAGYGIAVAVTTLVGHYLGAQAVEAAWRSMRSALVLVCGLMGSMGLGFLLWRAALVAVYTQEPAVAQIASPLLIFVALFQLCDGLTLVATGVLRGAGNTRWPMLIMLLLNWGVFVPLAALAMFVWPGGIMAGWAVALGSAMVISLVLGLRLLRGPWAPA
ncbi:MAG: MATE family efflux transporter [Candidatus Tectimicrobiota bacterium]